MELRETTFDEFYEWCKANKHEWYAYMTIDRLRIIYDYCVKHHMKCTGRNLRVSWKGNEFISSWSEPCHEPITREMLVWELFHDVWCKTEWAVRCGKSEAEIGYSAVISEFGRDTIRRLYEGSTIQREHKKYVFQSESLAV